MASYRATLESARPRGELFAYLANFANAQEWDPGVIEAQRLDSGPVVLGSGFRLLNQFLGRSSELVYRIVALELEQAVTFRGENATVISNDQITFTPVGGGDGAGGGGDGGNGGGATAITYDAQLTLKGAWRLLDPLLALAFKRTGDRALAGLRARLSQDGPLVGDHIGG